MTENKAFLLNELEEVKAWEKDQSGLWFWEKLSRLPFKLIDKLTPAFIQNKIGQLLDEMGNYIQSGGKLLSDISSSKKYYKHLNVQHFDEVKDLPLIEMKSAVEKLKKSRKNIATIQGASTGIGGFLTLGIDIPILLSMQIKILQDIAICYGYNPNEKKERIFIIKCLQYVSADVLGKNTILDQLSHFDQEADKVQREVLLEMQGWKEVVFAYRDTFGWKKLFQMVPVFGVVFGAFSNRSMIHDIAETGEMFYRKRKVLERLHNHQH